MSVVRYLDHSVLEWLITNILLYYIDKNIILSLSDQDEINQGMYHAVTDLVIFLPGAKYKISAFSL